MRAVRGLVSVVVCTLLMPCVALAAADTFGTGDGHSGVLSLAAKSLLAWQIYGGSLAT